MNKAAVTQAQKKAELNCIKAVIAGSSEVTNFDIIDMILKSMCGKIAAGKANFVIRKAAQAVEELMSDLEVNSALHETKID